MEKFEDIFFKHRESQGISARESLIKKFDLACCIGRGRLMCVSKEFKKSPAQLNG